MDIGKRSAEVANVLGAILLLGDFVSKHGWWQMPYLKGFLDYAFPLSILVALGMNAWILHRREEAEPAVSQQTSAAHAASTLLIAPQLPPQLPRQVAPVIGITLRETVVEAYDNTPGRHYPRKLRLYCSNDGDDIHVGVGRWIPDQIGLQAGKPPACQYELKEHLGKFSNESSDKFIASGKWFRLYVGLDSSISDKELARMKTERSFGILEIPAEISGVPVIVRIRP